MRNQRKIVCSRAGPTETIESFAALNSAIAFRYERQLAGSLLRPFAELEPRRGEDVAEARVLPLARIAEAVEVEVVGGQAAEAGRRVVLDHRVAGALDAAGDAQRAQQVANQAGLAGPQAAVELDAQVRDLRTAGQRLREALAGGLVGPTEWAGF